MSAKLRPATSLCFLWDHCTMICRFQAKISQNPKVAGHNAATPQASTSFRFWGFGQLAVAKALQIRKKTMCVWHLVLQFGTWFQAISGSPKVLRWFSSLSVPRSATSVTWRRSARPNGYLSILYPAFKTVCYWIKDDKRWCWTILNPERQDVLVWVILFSRYFTRTLLIWF